MSREYSTAKAAAFRAADEAGQTDMVETIDMLLSASDDVSDARAVEVMERLTHLVKCRIACANNRILREAV